MVLSLRPCLLYISTLTDPSGTVSNVSGIALNATHIHLTWDHPPRDLWHGNLSRYRIDVVEVESGTALTFFTDPDITETIIGSLHPYYTYNCTISAVTVGEGPPSTVITVRTAEDGMFQ
jgi:receptor-type tyrosine-protein phosphatase Q